MISSQLHQHIEGFDEIVDDNDPNFTSSGLKTSSVIRVERLAAIDGKMLLGVIGEIDSERLNRVRGNLVNWLAKD
jgi:mRNA interferase MazF